MKCVAPESNGCCKSSCRIQQSGSKSAFAKCCSVSVSLCNCTALCALQLQLKNQCEDHIHPSKGPVMCESQWARARPACDYLLFQLFPSLPPVSRRESGVYVHVCVDLEVRSGGVEVRWRHSEF